MSKKKKIWIASAAVVALGAIIYFSINATRRDETVVQTAKAQRKDILKSKVSASGEIKARYYADLQTEVAGVVNELLVREGDVVKKGDILLKIDPIQTESQTRATSAQYDAAMADARAQEFQILNAESNLARDEAMLRSSKAELEQAETNDARIQNSYRRKQQLHEDGLISREEYEAAQTDAKVSKAQLEVAKARVAQQETQIKVSKNNIQQMKASYASSQSRTKSMEANLTQANDLLQKTILKSPMNGVITSLIVQKGERAVPGIMSNPQATLMTIADLSIIEAELKVDETDVVNVALGNKATVKIDALPDTPFEGDVTEIGNAPMTGLSTGTTTQEAKDFKVKVTLRAPSNKLRPGMSCTGDITTNTKNNVLVIPIQALTIREVEVDKDGKYHEPELKKKKEQGVAQADTSKDKTKKKELEGVFVINKDKVARFRPVKTGITGESEIEIMDNLKEGEEVVSGSFQTLRTIKDGAAVKIDNSSKAQPEKKS